MLVLQVVDGGSIVLRQGGVVLATVRAYRNGTRLRLAVDAVPAVEVNREALDRKLHPESYEQTQGDGK